MRGWPILVWCAIPGQFQWCCLMYNQSIALFLLSFFEFSLTYCFLWQNCSSCLSLSFSTTFLFWTGNLSTQFRTFSVKGVIFCTYFSNLMVVSLFISDSGQYIFQSNLFRIDYITKEQRQTFWFLVSCLLCLFFVCVEFPAICDQVMPELDRWARIAGTSFRHSCTYAK